MTLSEIEVAARATLDDIVAELSAHRAVAARGNSADYHKETAILDRLDVAREAWNAAWDAADAAYMNT